MKKSILLIGGLLMACFVAAWAQTDNKNNSLLWRITGKGLAKPSYLFGTIHLICPDDYLWTDSMKKSLDACEKVCFEMDLDDRQTMIDASEGMMDTSGKSLDQYFTPEQYKRLKKFVEDSVGLDIALFRQMKPIALQSVIEMRSSNCPIPVSYEETIMRTAQEAHKEILGLEQASEQVDVLATLPADSVVKEMMEDVDNFAKSKKDYNDLISAYKKQQLPELYRMITATATEADDMAAFLDNRNKNWIARIPEKMKKGAIFFAVGAGHLWGDNGVINLLRKAGYTVEPIRDAVLPGKR